MWKIKKFIKSWTLNNKAKRILTINVKLEKLANINTAVAINKNKEFPNRKIKQKIKKDVNICNNQIKIYLQGNFLIKKINK